MPFLTALENQAGKRVDESTLVGKVVVLYFSSSWCEYHCKIVRVFSANLFFISHAHDGIRLC